MSLWLRSSFSPRFYLFFCIFGSKQILFSAQGRCNIANFTRGAMMLDNILHAHEKLGCHPKKWKKKQRRNVLMDFTKLEEKKTDIPFSEWVFICIIPTRQNYILISEVEIDGVSGDINRNGFGPIFKKKDLACPVWYKVGILWTKLRGVL